MTRRDINNKYTSTPATTAAVLATLAAAAISTIMGTSSSSAASPNGGFLLHANAHGISDRACVHDHIISELYSQHNSYNLLGGQYLTNKNAEVTRDTVGGRQPIRIVFRTDDMSQADHFCAAAEDKVSDHYTRQLRNVVCTEAFTATQRALLIDTVLPAIENKIAEFVAVDRVTSTIKVANDVCSKHVFVPEADTTTGVGDADFVVYVSAAPIDVVVDGTQLKPWTWGGMCAVTPDGQPVVGKINFDPQYVTAANTEELIRLGVHEMVHVLGFSWPYLKSEASGVASHVHPSNARLGQPNVEFRATGVLDVLQSAVNCNELTGAELEVETSNTAATSHWERRFFKDDIMTPYVTNTDQMAYSAMTFGALAAMPFYSIVGGAPFETPRWMNRAGCNVFKNKCSTVAGGAGRYFCNTQGAVEQCTHDYLSSGPCGSVEGTAVLPAWAQYFGTDTTRHGLVSYMNYCPMVAVQDDSRTCNNAGNQQYAVSGDGATFGASSRCFGVTAAGFGADGFAGSNQDRPTRCLETRCLGGTSVQVRVAGATEWITCPDAGVALAPSGHFGAIVCPKVVDICLDESLHVAGDPPTSMGLMVTLGDGVTPQQFINQFTDVYALEGDDTIAFVGWATEAQAAAAAAAAAATDPGLNGSPTLPPSGAARAFNTHAEAASSNTALFVLSGEGAATSGNAFPYLSPTELANVFGVSAAYVAGVETIQQEKGPSGELLSGASGMGAITTAMAVFMATVFGVVAF